MPTSACNRKNKTVMFEKKKRKARTNEKSTTAWLASTALLLRGEGVRGGGGGDGGDGGDGGMAEGEKRALLNPRGTLIVG